MQLLDMKPGRGDGYHIQAADGEKLWEGGSGGGGDTKNQNCGNVPVLNCKLWWEISYTGRRKSQSEILGPLIQNIFMNMFISLLCR